MSARLALARAISARRASQFLLAALDFERLASADFQRALGALHLPCGGVR